MATSHYCNGEWRDGPVESCSRHKRLSKKQINVYKGVGDPGGRSGQGRSSESDSKGGSSGAESSGKSSSSAGAGSSSKD